jgi:hypothetical protein
MADFTWYELYPPRDLDLAAITSFVRVLTARSRQGPLKYTPVVAFEVWGTCKHVRWLMGMEQELTASLPSQLQANFPRLGIVKRERVSRPLLERTSNVRVVGMARPIRLDVASSVTAGLLDAFGKLGRGEYAVVQWVLGPSQGRKVAPKPFDLAEVLGFREPEPPLPGEQQAWQKKTLEPLYAVRGRIGCSTRSVSKTRALIYTLAGALSLANAPHTELRVSKPRKGRARALQTVYGFGGTWSGVLNAAEVATLLGWMAEGVESPLLRRGYINPAPARLLLPPNSKRRLKERVLGTSLHPADGGQVVTMPLGTSSHHCVVSGPTGSGKSNLLASVILADINAGRGVFVLEPRGDLIADVLSRYPKHRRDDLVVIDAADNDQVGFNPLAGPLHDAERRADELLGLFRALYGTAIGARSADVLFHSLLTVARLEDGTLADVPILWANSSFRRRVLAKVSDPLVLGPWWAEFEGRSEADKQAVLAPIRNKLTAFLSRRPIRRMLGQGKPVFSLDESFMERPRVVLLNLNEGRVGSDASKVLGTLWLSAAWQAAQRRAALPIAKRFPVMWTIDEFPSYVGALDFGDVLAKARALGVPLCCAFQQDAQLSPTLRAAVTANARSKVAFRPSQDDLRALAAVFGPTVTPDDLEQLQAFEACVRLLVDRQLAPPFTVKTLPLLPATADAAELRRASRERYAMRGDVLDDALLARWQGRSDGSDAPIGLKPRRPS